MSTAVGRKSIRTNTSRSGGLKHRRLNRVVFQKRQETFINAAARRAVESLCYLGRVGGFEADSDVLKYYAAKKLPITGLLTDFVTKFKAGKATIAQARLVLKQTRTLVEIGRNRNVGSGQRIGVEPPWKDLEFTFLELTGELKA